MSGVADFLQYARSKGKGVPLFKPKETSGGVAARTAPATSRPRPATASAAVPPLPFMLNPAKKKAEKEQSSRVWKSRQFTSVEELRALMQPTAEDVRKAYDCEQKTDDWFAFRMDRLTGSTFGSAAGHNPHAAPCELLKRMLWGEFCESKHTIHGTFYEDEARQAYVLYKLLKLAGTMRGKAQGCGAAGAVCVQKEVTAVAQERGDKACWYDDMPQFPSSSESEVVYFDEPPVEPERLASTQGAHARPHEASTTNAPYVDPATGNVHVPFKCWECGIMLRTDMWHVGCSPDGLVDECGSEGCLEIKCPSAKREFYASDPRYARTGIPPYYYDQIQGLMHFSGRKWCDFVVYVVVPESCERKMWIRRYFYEEDYCTRVLFPKLDGFYFERYVPLRIAQIKGNLPEGSIRMPPLRLGSLLSLSAEDNTCAGDPQPDFTTPCIRRSPVVDEAGAQSVCSYEEAPFVPVTQQTFARGDLSRPEFAFALGVETCADSERVTRLTCVLVSTAAPGVAIDQFDVPVELQDESDGAGAVATLSVSAFGTVWDDFVRWCTCAVGKFEKKNPVVALLTHAATCGDVSALRKEVDRSCHDVSLGACMHACNVTISTTEDTRDKTAAIDESIRKNRHDSGTRGSDARDCALLESLLVLARSWSCLPYPLREVPSLASGVCCGGGVCGEAEDVSVDDDAADTQTTTTADNTPCRKRARSSRRGSAAFDCDETLRRKAAEGISGASSWEDMWARLAQVDCEVKAVSSGLALWQISSNRRICRSHELGWAYPVLVKRFGGAMPGHPRKVQSTLETSE